MKRKKNIVSIILARGGSKGIKNKNLINIAGKPLLYWSLKDCKNSKKIHVLKTTSKYALKFYRGFMRINFTVKLTFLRRPPCVLLNTPRCVSPRPAF